LEVSSFEIHDGASRSNGTLALKANAAEPIFDVEKPSRPDIDENDSQAWSSIK